jgi:hypothetical protein
MISQRHVIGQQFSDESLESLKSSFSVNMNEVAELGNLVLGMMADLKAAHPSLAKGRPQAPGQMAPQALTGANLQQQQLALKQQPQGHQRSNSRGSHPPAAPTSAQPPFQFGASSPHGTPIAYGNQAVTRENLQLPQKKKPKITGGMATSDSQATTKPTASPQAVKASPSATRKAEPKVETKPAFVCPEPECDRHTLGFSSKEELSQHTQEEHIQPRSDPAKYVEDSLMAALGLDEDGNPLQPLAGNADTSANQPSNEQAQGHASQVKSGATPTTAPANATSIQQATTGSEASKSAIAATAPTKQSELEDPWANSAVNPQDLLQNFGQFESAANGAISDLSVYRSITPNDTPESSKDGASAPDSDISDGVNLNIDLNVDLQGMNNLEDWQPFGGPLFGDLNTMGNMSADGAMDVDGMKEVDASLKLFGEGVGWDVTAAQSWEEMVDESVFDKPFNLDTSFFELNAME